MLDLSLETIGPGSNNAKSPLLSANGNTMEINLGSLAENNNGEKAHNENSDGNYQTIYFLMNNTSHFVSSCTRNKGILPLGYLPFAMQPIYINFTIVKHPAQTFI